MVERITLYTNETCPWAQRTRIALAEVGATWTEYEVDLQNKPDFFAKKVNPASKVPAIAYGGPEVPLDQPAASSIKIAESGILVEFIADLFPKSGLLPQDPVKRAQNRFFVDYATTKLVPAWLAFSFKGASYEPILQAIEYLQALLDPKGPFFAGESFTAADADIAPFIARLYGTAKHEVVINEGEGAKFLQAFQDDKYTRFRLYVEKLLERKSVSSTFPEAKLVSRGKERIAALKAEQLAAAAA